MSLINSIKNKLILLTIKTDFISKTGIFFYVLFSPINKKFAELFLFKDYFIVSRNGAVYFCNKYSSKDLFSQLPSSNDKALNIIFDSKPKIFFDIGANFGKFTFEVANKLNSKCYAFEPELNNIFRFQKNLILNKGFSIYLVKSAVSDKNKSMDFFISDLDGCHSLSKVNCTKYSKKFIKVKSVTLDNFCFKKKIFPDFIKIDVEGFESLVIKGGKKVLSKYKPKILFEAWDESKLNICKSLLKEYGYSNFKKIDDENYLAEN